MTAHTSKLLATAILKASNGLRSGMLESRLCTCGEVRHDGACVIRENRIRAVGAGKNHSTVDALAGIGTRVPVKDSQIPDEPEAAHGDGCRSPLPGETVRDWKVRNDGPCVVVLRGNK